jgi:Flp pilus assembly pilin Flp
MWCRTATPPKRKPTDRQSGRSKMENEMLRNAIVRLVREDEGMEMVEWSIVGVVFALAGALLWSTLKKDISTALGDIGNCVKNSSNCK